MIPELAICFLRARIAVHSVVFLLVFSVTATKTRILDSIVNGNYSDGGYRGK
jgi:hypothetical protein